MNHTLTVPGSVLSSFTPEVQSFVLSGQAAQQMGGRMVLGNYAAPSTVHINVPLQNLLVGYDFPTQFIADQVIPVLPVVNESDIYYRWDRSPWNRREQTLVPPRARAREVRPTFDTDVYKCERFALATSIEDRERRNADNQLRLEETSVAFIKYLIMLDMEVRAATLLTAANFTGATLSGANQFDNASFTASGVPIEKRFDDAKLAMRQALGGFEPTHVIIPDAVAKVMKRDSVIRDLIKYTTNALVNGDLPDTLWGLKVVIPKSMYTLSPEGTAEGSVTYSDVWGKSIRFVYVPPVPAIRVPATAYQFRVTAENFTVRQWRDDPTRVDYFEVAVMNDMKRVTANGCYVYENAIA